MSPSNETRPSRRAVVALGTGLGAGLTLLATGCRIGGTDPADGRTTSAKPSADITTIGTAVRLLEESIARLRAITDAPAPVAASLRLHEVHLSRLRGVTPASSQAAPSTATYPRHLGPVARTGERQLVRLFTGFAQRAESGDLARLFAAMAAATSQRLEAWPAAGGAR